MSDEAERFVRVSVLFNEPKLLKLWRTLEFLPDFLRFSALQRAEIAEIENARIAYVCTHRVSVLFNEPKLLK